MSASRTGSSASRVARRLSSSVLSQDELGCNACRGPRTLAHSTLAAGRFRRSWTPDFIRAGLHYRLKNGQRPRSVQSARDGSLRLFMEYGLRVPIPCGSRLPPAGIRALAGHALDQLCRARHAHSRTRQHRGASWPPDCEMQRRAHPGTSARVTWPPENDPALGRAQKHRLGPVEPVCGEPSGEPSSAYMRHRVRLSIRYWLVNLYLATVSHADRLSEPLSHRGSRAISSTAASARPLDHTAYHAMTDPSCHGLHGRGSSALKRRRAVSGIVSCWRFCLPAATPPGHPRWSSTVRSRPARYRLVPGASGYCHLR